MHNMAEHGLFDLVGFSSTMALIRKLYVGVCLYDYDSDGDGV